MTTLMGSPWTRRRVARAAGGLYLAFIMASVLAFLTENTNVIAVEGDKPTEDAPVLGAIH